MIYRNWNCFKPIIILLMMILVSCGEKKNDKLQANSSAVNEESPNVIVILIDDAGYVDFGFMGSKDLETPRIDELASSGIKFTDAHVSASVCAPSRAGLITGKYQQRFGFEANGGGANTMGLSDDVITMADVFKENDYRTFALGKWHLGENPTDHPNNRGFDEFYGFLAGSRSYFPIKDPSKAKMLQHNGERVKFNGYMTDILGDQSVKFVEENKDHPFFMYLAYNAVHTPMDAKKEDLEKFEGHHRQKLAAMTWSLDENIGKLLDKLKELHLRENTLIYFLSDNGGAHNNQSSTGPLKGFKGNEFEGGHRVPFVISWPKNIKPQQTFEGLTSSLDIFPTSLAAAHINPSKDLLLDGVNLLPYLDRKKEGNPHQQLFWRKLEESAARYGDYKLVSLDKYGSVIYNLRNDLGEMNDLSKTQPHKLDSLLNFYNQWESKLMNPLWDEGDEWMDVTYNIQKMLMQNKEPLYKDPQDESFKKHRIRIDHSTNPK